MYHARTLITDLRNAQPLERSLFLVAIVSSVITLGLWLSLGYGQQHERPLTVSFLDVGQGDAIYIESPGGTDILIDGGETQAVIRERAKLEPFWDRDIDLVIATHPDADHIGGLVDVFERLHVDAIGISGTERDTDVFEMFQDRVEDEGARVEVFERGERVHVEDNVFLTVLAPVNGFAGDANETSIVVRLDYGETSLLFTGDAPASVERTLALDPSEVDVDVLKVGHHGSDTSTSPDFVRAVSPAAAVISVGADNRYGHPSQTVLNTLDEEEVNVIRTDEHGTAVFMSDGQNIEQTRLPFFEQIF